MNLATNLFIIFTLSYVYNVVKRLFSKKSREEHKVKREEMNMLRNQEHKTIEDQKRFLDLKYPKKIPQKITINSASKVILKIALVVAVFISTKRLWAHYIVYQFSLWMIVLYAIGLPMIVNFVLKKFHLEDDDFSIFFK